MHIPERVLLDDTEVLPFPVAGRRRCRRVEHQRCPTVRQLCSRRSSGLLPTAGAARLGGAIGHVYGQIIIEALHRGGFPMEREMGLLMGLARSSVSAVERLAAGRAANLPGGVRAGAGQRRCTRRLSGGGAPGGRAATLDELERRFGTSDADGVACQSADPKPMCFEEWLATLVPSTDEANDAGTGAEEVRRLRTSKI
jgi:hypothetical protein